MYLIWCHNNTDRTTRPIRNKVDQYGLFSRIGRLWSGQYHGVEWQRTTRFFFLRFQTTPWISVFRNLSRFYIHLEDKTETPCDVTNYRLTRQNGKKTTENKQYWGTDGCSSSLVEDYFRYDELAQIEAEAYRIGHWSSRVYGTWRGA